MKKSREWFAKKAESFARFFGTPKFLIAQTLFVAVWIFSNVIGWVHFDLYPFILLNLAFSLQAAYAAPLILLAQTRQANRDKKNAEHRALIAKAGDERGKQILELQRLTHELIKEIHKKAHSDGVEPPTRSSH